MIASEGPVMVRALLQLTRSVQLLIRRRRSHFARPRPPRSTSAMQNRQNLGRLRDNLRQRWKGVPRHKDGRVRITVSDEMGVTERMTPGEICAINIGAKLCDALRCIGDKYVAQSSYIHPEPSHDTHEAPQPSRYAHIVVDRSQFDRAGPLFVDYDVQLHILHTVTWCDSSIC